MSTANNTTPTRGLKRATYSVQDLTQTFRSRAARREMPQIRRKTSVMALGFVGKPVGLRVPSSDYRKVTFDLKNKISSAKPEILDLESIAYRLLHVPRLCKKPEIEPK